MRSSAWSPRTLGKYVLLQLPGYLLLIALLLLARHLADFPLWILWVVPAVWILKDVILYPFVWRSYSPDTPPSAMIGLSGEARERIDRQGYITIRGELWRCELAPGAAPIEAGRRVRVRDQRGLTLIVTGAEEQEPPSGSETAIQ